MELHRIKDAAKRCSLAIQARSPGPDEVLTEDWLLQAAGIPLLSESARVAEGKAHQLVVMTFRDLLVDTVLERSPAVEAAPTEFMVELNR